jgi:hypothetical protein
MRITGILLYGIVSDGLFTNFANRKHSACRQVTLFRYGISGTNIERQEISLDVLWLSLLDFKHANAIYFKL